ncbi:MAG: four helix bundle protein [Deltaproteobacteria bacterium]|nr:four helix bundle protein [Deltaproteobacteria bacterium]
MGEDRLKSLEVWKKSDDPAFRICELTKRFPKEELYGLTS